MSVYTIICSLIGRSDSLGREGVQVYVLFLPYMYLLMNLYLAPDKLPLTPHPYSICHNNKESKKGGGKNASCIYFFLLSIYVLYTLQYRVFKFWLQHPVVVQSICLQRQVYL